MLYFYRPKSPLLIPRRCFKFALKDNCHIFLELNTVSCFCYIYRKDGQMSFEHDPESPFLKITVKDGPSVVGIIRRNLQTGDYHFYESERDALSCLFQEKRIDRIKMRIEELHNLREVV